jgi:hypothetical protein
MKRKLILFLFFLCSFWVLAAQTKQQGLKLKLTTFLFRFSKKDNTDSVKQYIITFSANKKGKIKKCSFYRLVKGVVFKENSSDFNGQDLDSLYSITGTEKNQHMLKVTLPVIIKNTTDTKYSEKDKLFSIFEVENMYQFLRGSQLKLRRFTLLNPLIFLKIPDEF